MRCVSPTVVGVPPLKVYLFLVKVNRLLTSTEDPMIRIPRLFNRGLGTRQVSVLYQTYSNIK